MLLLLILLKLPAIASETTFTVKQYREVHGLGLLPKTETTKAFLKSLPKHASFSDDDSVPGSYDLTKTETVSGPENQGSCGSCWDFSLTKALRSALMLAGKDPGVLGFNFLLNNCGKGPQMYGCNGGMFEAGQSFLNGGGPWLESQDPYTQSEGNCKQGLLVAGTALEMVSVGGDSPSFKEVATAVSQRHFLSIDVAVQGSWGSYSGGIYNGNGSGINHMIDMVGYDCQTSVDAFGKCAFNSTGEPLNGDGFFKVQNNWGTSWGEQGYMRTRAHRNQIATTAVYFRVKEQPKPVNGGYSDWSKWTDCVDGKQTHSRTCTNPAPSYGGLDCQGPPTENQVCTVPSPTPGPDSGTPVWAWIVIVGLAGLIGGGVLVLVFKIS